MSRFSPSSNDVVFAGTGNDAHRPDPSGIYRSNDGGQSWTLRHQFIDPSSGNVFPVGQLAIADDDPRLMFAAGGVALARSLDGGTTLDRGVADCVGASSRIWHVVIAPAQVEGRRDAMRAATMIWESVDGGDHWTAFSVPVALGGRHRRRYRRTRTRCIRQTCQGLSVECGSNLARAVSRRNAAAAPQWVQFASVPIIAQRTDRERRQLHHRAPDPRQHGVFIASDRRTTCIAASGARSQHPTGTALTPPSTSTHTRSHLRRTCSCSFRTGPRMTIMDGCSSSTMGGCIPVSTAQQTGLQVVACRRSMCATSR